MASETTERETRYLEVTVTRTQSSVVYLAVPADHPGLVPIESPIGSPEQRRLLAAVRLAREHVQAAAETTVEPTDWNTGEPPEGVEVVGVREVPEAEARQFKVYEVPGPTAAERRQASEKAGQRELEL